MPGPANAGLFIYAKDLDHLGGFYETVCSMAVLHRSDDLIVLESPDIQLLVHAIPASIAAGITITAPPQWREETPLKFFFTVPDLSKTTAIIAGLGGEVATQRWSGPGFVAVNACDPEGNIFQLRQKTG
ncbi:VOC family protein [Tahibacter amnicola]|uniref:Glyoxalase/bleomycin resistance/dioxygenase family protein n=1 Tax=Tahibacter amnicola TaxID=2976241 RepID=A0ABY6BJI5_9GAMM|nr:VOC family protein [Tahibacter amnicola]UXI70176.1 glyoxalase/bleomycin resistance/dioxygenase family protein [Tahibacter amnicola]